MLFKRLFCLLLACLMSLGVCALAEDDSGKTYVMAGYDNTQYREWKENLFFARMEEKTGVSFEFQQYSDSAKWTAAKDAMVSGGNLPDVLFKASLSSTECMKMLEKGVLIDLKPYLEENCPHLWALLSQNPEYLQAITLPDGSIVALPYITTTPIQNYIWINEAWLAALRLEAPTTAQELTQVLEAFKTRDPNKNNKKDEIPLGFLGAFDLKFLAHAYGMIANDYNIYVEDDQVEFMPLHENFRQFITWCRDLYQRGLLDEDGFSTNNVLRQVSDSDAIATYGAIITPVAAELFLVSWASDYGILQPLVYDGEQIYRDFSGEVLRGTFAITSACDDPAKMLQWVDYLYSEEGALLASIGLENQDYTVNADGTWELMESARSDTFFAVSALIDGGGTSPGILADAFQRRYAGNPELLKTVESQDQVKAVCQMPFPYYTLTAEQIDFITPLQNDIGYYVDMQIARWVIGEEEISDETFAEFHRTLEEKGLSTFLAFWQDVLNNL
ncbi:MAG: extracellular solute-binding protein [Clostridiales bacterium]|nr:extracellular solute-binding protein [Clostridiales bacterium]